MPTIPEMLDETVPSEKGYYHGVYVMPHFNREDIVDIKEEKVDMEPDPDEEYM